MDHGRIARVVLGLAAALALAVLAAHPKVRALERRLGFSVLISAGLPFLALGLIFRLKSVGILTGNVLGDLRPAFDFGLGWIGFVVGLQFDIRRLDRLPRSLGGAIALESVVPMATTAILCFGVLYALQGFHLGGSLIRDVLVLMACAAASARVSGEALARVHGKAAGEMVEEMSAFDEIAALAVLGLVAIFFRPTATATAWVLPPSAWLLVSLGLGTVLGAVTYILLRGAESAAEELALLLGSVALAAGVAGHLAFSVPVTCAMAGALLTNLPLREGDRLKRLMLDVERPLYLIFLLVVGAAWRPYEWQGWVLAPVFVLARVLGKAIGARWAQKSGPQELPPARSLALALMPQSPIAIVVIVSAGTLFGNENPQAVRWAINAVIVGGVLTEIVVRLLQRGENQRYRETMAAIPVSVVLPPPAPPPAGDAAA